MKTIYKFQVLKKLIELLKKTKQCENTFWYFLRERRKAITLQREK